MPTTAAILRAARLAAGLSAREAARRAGLSGSSVSQAERGRDPVHDTLERLARVLPALDASALLGRPCPPPALVRVATFLESSLGFVARSVRISAAWTDGGLGPVRLEAQGLRSVRLDTRDPEVRRALALACCEGSGGAAHRLAAAIDEGDGPWCVEDGGVDHELRVRGGALHYVRQERPGATRLAPPWGEPFETGISTWIRHPVRRLEIGVTRDHGAPALVLTPHAWPARILVDPHESHAAWDALFPDGPHGAHVLRSQSARLVVLHPPLACCVGLQCAPAGEADLERPSTRSWTAAGPSSRISRRAPVGARLAAARTREGLSQRELGRRCGLSSSSVAEVESGVRAPRASTLAAFLRALPGLSPHALVPRFDDPEPCDAGEAWAWLRDVYGLVSDEELTRIDIARDGTCRYACSVLGLRFLPGRARALRLRHGLTAARGGLAAPKLVALSSDVPEGALTVKVTRREAGALVHEIRLGAELAERPVSYERTLVAARPLPMTEELSPMFLTAAPLLPTRRLRLLLRFPRGTFPSRHVAGCSPELMHVLDEGVEDLRERLHPSGWEVVASPGKATLELVVEHPLLGIGYGLGIWPPVRVSEGATGRRPLPDRI